MAGPLQGIRIVEFAGIGPAPFAAMLLADMGAEIVRVDRPGAPKMVPDPITGRGRATVIADLKDASDVEQVAKLIDRADAVIEGFRPGVLERLGLAPDVLIARNPKLVVGRMTGWGQEGPLAGYAGHDINYIAITGALAAIGPAERAVPPLNLVGDYGGGALYLVSGMLAALLSATRTGKGQVVDAAMCDGALSLMSFFFEFAAAGAWRTERESNMLDGGAPYYGVYTCADGMEIAVGAIEPQFHALFYAGLGLATNALPDRNDRANWPALRAHIAGVFASKPRAHWLAVLENSDACVAPVLKLDEVHDNAHIAARGSMIEVNGVRQPAPAPRFSHTPSVLRSDARQTIDLAEAQARWQV